MTRDEIITDMARILHICAYADAIEDERFPGDAPGPGGDWLDYAPETSAAALELAGRIAADVENRNGVGLVELAERYHAAGALLAADGSSRFGHALAMMAVGHGVSPADDVPGRADYANPDCGLFEFYYFDTEDMVT